MTLRPLALFAPLLALLFAPLLARADDPPPKADTQPTTRDGAAVYKQAVPSVVWVLSKRANGAVSGSGSLVDAERRLVLTNYHVVQDTPTATVFFPEFKNGQPVAEKDHYTDRARKLAVAAKVVALDKTADLAILRVASVPDKVKAVPLAAESPAPGADVHSIGNTGKSGALFGYVKGTVRQVYKKEWTAELEPKKTANFEARVIETDSATNHGDSGGPLLNSAGELVGVTQGAAVNAQLVSTFVDVSEVKKLLATKAVKEVAADKPDPPKEARKEPLAVADDAKLFSADAVKAANEVIAALHKDGLEVMVDTVKAVTDDADKLKELKAAKQADRVEFMKQFTLKRMEAKQAAAGIGVVVSTDPKAFYIDVSADARKLLPEKFDKKLVDALTSGLKANKPDDALADVLKLIRDAKKEAAKK